MKINNLKSILSALAFFLFTIFVAIPATAQTTQPELSVAGFRLGEDEEKVKTILQSYSPRFDNELGQPKYFFYNGYGNQVMSVTGYSKERPFLIVAIEVFSVNESYQKKHYQMKDINSFMSESGFFIGARPSVTSLLFAVPNITGPKEVIKKKGSPVADKKEKKARTLSYQFNAVGQLETQEPKLNGVDFGSYTAEYRFVKNKLRRFTIAVNASVPKTPTL